MRQSAWVVPLLLLCACPRPLPTPVEPRPPPPPAIKIPPGCGPSLSGDWQHEDDPTFRYHFDDNRTDVTVRVYRVFPALDAGAVERDDGGLPPLAAAVIRLERTANGFLGETEMLHLLPSGRECRATFPTQVTACTPSTLTMTSATSTPVGEGCQTPSLPQPAAMLEHRLARTDAGAL